MGAEEFAIGLSLGLLTIALVYLAVRGFADYLVKHVRVQLMWASGLALAAGAMAIETVVFTGTVNEPLLQAYVFLSAALVGVLSLGATRVLRSPRLESTYMAYIVAMTGVVGVSCFLVPVSVSSMVSANVISGDPPLSLLLLSTLITGPATVVLLASAAISLKRSRKWQTLLMIAGALVLGAGGTLYIASFPVALYYAEFIGIVLLFLGLVSLQRLAATTTAPAGEARTPEGH
jgi:hypothetical protein